MSEYTSETGQLFEQAVAVFRCRFNPAFALLVTSGKFNNICGFFWAAHTRIYCSAELFLSCLAGVTICTSLMLVSNQAVMRALLTQKIGTFKHIYSISLVFFNLKSSPGTCLQP